VKKCKYYARIYVERQKYIGLYRANGGHLGIQDGRHKVALKKWNQPQFESLDYKDSKTHRLQECSRNSKYIT